MNLARLGVVIDPTGAEAGSRRAVAAANAIRPAMQGAANAAGNLSTAMGTAGTAGQRAGGAVNEGMERARRGTRAAADEAKNATGAFDGLIGKMMRLVAVIGMAVVAYASLRTASDFLWSAINKAAEMEGFTTRWAFFLGSFDAAKAKMAELAQFANTTPFDLPGVTQAALALAKLKDTGLETMAGLRMVGDAAGIAGQPIEEVASRIARLINNLKRGGGSGDEARILGEWMVFSPELVGKLSEMGNKAENFKMLLGDIKKELGATAGGMLLMSGTWTGLMATLEDAWGAFKTAIGAPLLEGFKPLLQDITINIDKMTAKVKEWQPAIKEFAAGVTATFRTLAQEGGLKLGLKAGMDYLADLANRLWNAWAITLKSVFVRIAYEFKLALAEVNNPAFWSGIGKAMVNAATQFLSALRTGFGPWLKEMGDAFFEMGEVLQNKMSGGMIGRDRATIEADKAGGQQAVLNQKTQQMLDYARTNPGKPVTPQTAWNDPLPDSASAYDPTALLGPAPEITPVELAPITQTPAMKEFSTNWLWNLDGVLNQIIEQTKAGNDLVKQKAADRALAAAGGPDADLFPGMLPDDGKPAKDALLPGTDLAYKDAENEANRIKENAMTAEQEHQRQIERLAALREANFLTTSQEQAGIEKSKQTLLAAKDAESQKIKQTTEANMTQTQRLLASWGDLAKQVDAAGVAILQSIEGNITGGLVAMIDGTKSAKDAFADMAKGIINSILQIIVKLIVQYALMAAMGMAGSFTSFASSAISAGVKHEGGEVGGGGRSRTVPAAVFAGARRYHSGGMIGSNEVPIIAEKGETVITKDQANEIKARLGEGTAKEQGGGQPITILNYQNPADVAAHIAQNPDIVLNVLGSNAPRARQVLGLKS